MKTLLNYLVKYPYCIKTFLSHLSSGAPRLSIGPSCFNRNVSRRGFLFIKIRFFSWAGVHLFIGNNNRYNTQYRADTMSSCFKSEILNGATIFTIPEKTQASNACAIEY